MRVFGPAPLAATIFIAAASAAKLDPASLRRRVAEFNRAIPETVVNAIPDSQAAEWMEANIPLFACPDPDVERTWYYRWWAWRKHIKHTSAGTILTEFLRPVSHASDYNAISCALGHHVLEGRWVRDRKILDDYLRFWLTSGENRGLQRHFHSYSGWAANAVWQRASSTGDTRFAVALLDALLADYALWEKERQLPSGLFWQYDVRDGMEESVSGSRKAKNARPTINSYMYGNAVAIARIAAFAGRRDVEAQFNDKAVRLKELVQSKLWDTRAKFFKPLLEATGSLADVRELIGYTPWYFHLPDPGRGYEDALRQLMDPAGFHAPYGPTTAERRHPGFQIADEGDDCQWNGPSWPFSTTVTLKAMANVLHDYPQRAVTRDDWYQIFLNYTRSQRLRLPDGTVVPWIDENLNPLTGAWQARAMKIRKGKFDGRGDHYNHSGYADLVITGLVGLRPRADDIVELDPLLPADKWDWFALDRVPYHGHLLTITWDRTGKKFGRGLRLAVDGRQVASSPRLYRLTGRLGRDRPDR